MSIFVGNTANNLLKGFYMDTPANRKLGRVGREYDIAADFEFKGLIVINDEGDHQLVVKDKEGKLQRVILNKEDQKKVTPNHTFKEEDKKQMIEKYFGNKKETK